MAIAEGDAEGWLSNKQAAGLLGYAPDTLENMRYEEPYIGPPYEVWFGKTIRFRKVDVIAWGAAQKSRRLPLIPCVGDPRRKDRLPRGQRK